MGPSRNQCDDGGLRNPLRAVIAATDRQCPTLHIPTVSSKAGRGPAVNDSMDKTSRQAFLTGRGKFDSIPNYYDSRQSYALKPA